MGGPGSGRPVGSWGWRKRAQIECERLMATDYYDCCMCGANGNHDLLSEEEVEQIRAECDDDDGDVAM